MATAVENARDGAGELNEMVDTLQALLDIERHRADSLKEAVRAARRTGIAVGLIMAHDGIDADQAFSRLHDASHGAHGQPLLVLVEGVIAGRVAT